MNKKWYVFSNGCYYVGTSYCVYNREPATIIQIIKKLHQLTPIWVDSAEVKHVLVAYPYVHSLYFV